MTETHKGTNAPPPDAGAGPTVSSTPLGMGDQLHFQRYQQKNNKVLWGIFALLAALTGGVFFLLPNYVNPPDSASVVVVPTAAPGVAAAPAISPFEEAQRMRQREEAQNTLAALLELQEVLEDKEVLNWAEARFNDGIEQARKGDEAYRTQQFVAANAAYQAGLEILQDIQNSEERTYTGFISEGEAALVAGDAQRADQAFSQALLIRPTSSAAVAGMERATVLNQVLELLANGRNLHASNELEGARELYRQAQTIDAAHPEVGSALQQVEQDIAERSFAAAMSRGYAALQADNPAAAHEAFRQAQAMKPGSDEVTSALQQARDRQTFTALSVHIEAAERHETAENWEAALEEWNQALSIDPNLVTALDGQRRTTGRNNLDRFMQALIADPLRLGEDSVLAQTRQVLRDAEALPAPGPKLQAQMQQVRGFVERARVPVAVQLQSDGLTAVTVYRVGELGPFTNQTLSLVPGTYTAVGVRPGFRDVREEFVVAIDGQAPVVTIACNEAI